MSQKETQDKQELIDVWSENYDGNEQEQEIIREFNHGYCLGKTIWWYTRESFLYRILNKALREANLDILLGLRFFINDLYLNLCYHQKQFLSSRDSENPILCVYRGQAISVEELNLIRESQGAFISFNNFLSTSTIKKTSISFAKRAILTEELTRILFEFSIDTRLKNTPPYAEISALSYYPNEKEILIMIGSIFHIEEVIYDNDQQLWLAKLSLCDQEDYELNELVEHLNEYVGGGIDSLGWLFYQQGEYEKATKYFQQLLRDSSLNDFDKANCYKGLGCVASQLEQYDEALINYEKALELEKKSGDNEFFAESYGAIGEVYLCKKEFDKALSWQKKALSDLPTNHPDVSKIYCRMANIYTAKKEYELAAEYYENSLKIDRQHLHVNDRKFGITYQSMGVMYANKGDDEKALEYYYKARDIYLKSLPSNHPETLGIEQIIRNREFIIKIKQ